MKSVFTKAIDLISDFFINFRKKTVELEISDKEFEILLASEEFVSKMAHEAKMFLRECKKFLSVLKESISISTSAFSKSLFTSSASPKYYIWDNFKEWILDKASVVIPEFKGTLKSLKLSKNMNDSEILAEIGESNIFSIDEACAIFKALTEHQPNGESGDLLNNGYANIIYVRLVDGSVVPAFVRWNSGGRKWCLDACQFDDGNAWVEGLCVLVLG